jgi:hypothetical protein
MTLIWASNDMALSTTVPLRHVQTNAAGVVRKLVG